MGTGAEHETGILRQKHSKRYHERGWKERIVRGGEKEHG
jgi:hypothetical protein